jgi:hypothetical protein
MNKSERKIKEYFISRGFELEEWPEINICGISKKLDFKVNIDGWVYVEITNPNLSDIGKDSLSKNVAVAGKPHRFHNKVKNEYKQHFKGSNLDYPAVIIVDTEGSELSGVPLETVNFKNMPELSAVVSYNKIHLKYGRERKIGLIKTNHLATHQVSEKQKKILSFKL